MPKQNEFIADLSDTLEPLGTFTSRAMFGGHGLYLNGLIVGMVVDEVLYFKVDDGNRADYKAAGSRPFTYHHEARNEPVQMSYWQVPPEVLERPPALREWALKAHAASVRAKAGGGKKKSAKAGSAGKQESGAGGATTTAEVSSIGATKTKSGRKSTP
jgi:DNA transformation protein